DGLTAQVQANAVTAFGAVDAAGVARIDSFVQESTGQTWVMEINTTPGSFSFYLWEPSGVPFNELLRSVLDVAAEVHDAKSGLMYSFDSKMLAGTAGVKAGG
ncbi:MAG: D-alanine--D-alanine ligase, partial [Actinobacteria bacterium]|nr:D-alanine--D-alanine ligase [Actinomycetota bacterium]